jgi:mono/diheme cytochrome c family protein
MIAVPSWRTIVLSSVLTLGAILGSPRTPSARPGVERGRYMVLTGHCNNCHTAGYTKREGNVPEKDWLLGSSPFGYRGTWGTTYASNLRLSVQAFSEVEWVQYAQDTACAPAHALVEPAGDVQAGLERDLPVHQLVGTDRRTGQDVCASRSRADQAL